MSGISAYFPIARYARNGIFGRWRTPETADPLAAWVAHQQRALLRVVSIVNLVFGCSLTRYFFHRARYTLLVLLLRTVLHVIEFSLILYALPSVIYHAMVLRLLSLACEGSWWGATDAMRHRIRQLYRQRRTAHIRQEISGWLTLAAIIGALITMAALAWASAGYPLPYAALVLAFGFQTATRILMRTFYSGAYALRRVFMPMEFIIIPEIVIFLLGFGLRGTLGEWGAALCVLASTLTVAMISYVSVRRVTDSLRITPKLFFSRAALYQLLAYHRVRTVIMPAVAMVGIRLHDVILIMALQFLANHALFAQKLLFALYLVAPVLRGGMGWAQAMFFDLSRYHLDRFMNFRRTLERSGLRYALVISLFFCALAAAILRLSAEKPFMATAQIVMPYIIGYSMLGFVLMLLFARRWYGLVAALCLLQYALLWSFLVLKFGHLRIWQGLSLSLWIPLVLGVWQMRRPWAPPCDAILPYFSWAAAVKKLKRPVQLLKVAFHPAAKPAQLTAAAAGITAAGISDMACVVNSAVLAAGSACREKNTQDRLWRHGGGFITGVETLIAESGAAAYREARARGLLPDREGKEETRDALVAEFRQIFTAGMVQIPMQPNPELLAATTDADRHEILQEARKCVGMAPRHPSKQWFVTALYEDPYLTTLFIVPRASTTAENRQHWRQRVENYSIKILE